MAKHVKQLLKYGGEEFAQTMAIYVEQVRYISPPPRSRQPESNATIQNGGATGLAMIANSTLEVTKLAVEALASHPELRQPGIEGIV